jgi:hypothetical protein
VPSHTYSDIFKTFVLPSDPIRLVPVIITDSKAKYIKNYCINPIENSIKWWFKPGQNSTQGLAFQDGSYIYSISKLKI